MIEGNRSWRHALFENGMQVAAVNVGICSAKSGLARGIELDLVHRLAGVPGAADIGVCLDPLFDNHLFNAETAQHLHDVGAQNDSGADAGKSRGLLVNGDGEAGALQEAGDRHATEARPNHRYPRLPIHLRTPNMHRRSTPHPIRAVDIERRKPLFACLKTLQSTLAI